MALLLEWPNENAHRYYPFDPPAGNDVPTALILDLGIIATDNLPDNSGVDTTYISQIVTDGTQVRFYLATSISNVVTNFGCIATVDVSAEIGVRTNFKCVQDGIILEGYIITGDLSVTQQMPAVIELGATSGKLYTGCIQHMTQWLAGVRVGEQTLSGIVTLEAGAGVDISVVDNTIIISCTGAQIPLENQIIIDDNTLLTQLIDQYGCPISSINGQNIINGNWHIVASAEDALSVTTDAETSSITIKNLNAVGCCTQDDIATLVDNIGALNDRVGVLNQFLTQVDTNLNILSVQASRLT